MKIQLSSFHIIKLDFKNIRMKQMINRNLYGIYFRVERDGKWQNLCFSDLTEDEQRKVLKDKSQDFILQLTLILAKRLREVGDKFDLQCE